jgi:hypothetical protein
VKAIEDARTDREKRERERERVLWLVRPTLPTRSW